MSSLNALTGCDRLRISTASEAAAAEQKRQPWKGDFGPAMTRCLIALATAFAVSLFAISAAHAVDAVNVRLDAAAIDLTAATEVQKTEGDRIQVSTAPGPDGIVRRIE